MTPPYTQRQHDNAMRLIWVVAALVVASVIVTGAWVGHI